MQCNLWTSPDTSRSISQERTAHHVPILTSQARTHNHARHTDTETPTQILSRQFGTGVTRRLQAIRMCALNAFLLHWFLGCFLYHSLFTRLPPSTYSAAQPCTLMGSSSSFCKNSIEGLRTEKHNNQPDNIICSISTLPQKAFCLITHPLIRHLSADDMASFNCLTEKSGTSAKTKIIRGSGQAAGVRFQPQTMWSSRQR